MKRQERDFDGFGDFGSFSGIHRRVVAGCILVEFACIDRQLAFFEPDDLVHDNPPPTLTHRCRFPIPHHPSEPLHDRPALDRFLGSSRSHLELLEHDGGNLITSELSEQFLLSRQIQILVRQDLLLRVVRRFRSTTSHTGHYHTGGPNYPPKSHPNKTQPHPPESACDKSA